MLNQHLVQYSKEITLLIIITEFQARFANFRSNVEIFTFLKNLDLGQLNSIPIMVLLVPRSIDKRHSLNANDRNDIKTSQAGTGLPLVHG